MKFTSPADTVAMTGHGGDASSKLLGNNNNNSTVSGTNRVQERYREQWRLVMDILAYSEPDIDHIPEV